MMLWRKFPWTSAKLLPQVVLLDIGMPNLNGYDAARQIRQQAWGKDMVLIALTGWGQEQDRERTREAGFDAHLLKPGRPRCAHEVIGLYARPYVADGRLASQA